MYYIYCISIIYITYVYIHMYILYIYILALYMYRKQYNIFVSFFFIHTSS